jgi:hypothetical protein
MQQPTAVYPNNDEEDEDEDTLGHAQAVATGAGVGGGNKKGESHMISGFTDKKNEVLCISWLAVSQDSINGSQQKGQAYWCKVSQDYNERKLHKPSFNIIKNCNDESIKKIWAYIKQETHKLCVAIDHVHLHPESGTNIIEVVMEHHHHIYVHIFSDPNNCICRCLRPWRFSRPNGRRASTSPPLEPVEGGSQMEDRLYGLQGSPQECHGYSPPRWRR